MNKEEIKQKLKDEGFEHIYEWTDKPDAEYKEHTHEGRVCFYVIEGGIDMVIGGLEEHFKAPERVDVPPGVPHTAKVGSEGCTFVIGEEIKGDS